MAIINYDGISGINSITSVGSGVQFYDTTGASSFTITPSSTGANIGTGANVTGNIKATGSIYVSTANTTGGGIVLSDDGDIVDLNDGYASIRFSNGVRIYNTRGGGIGIATIAISGYISARNTAKCFGSWYSNALGNTMNVSSFSDQGGNVRRVNFTTAFNTNGYAVSGYTSQGDGVSDNIPAIVNKSTGYFEMISNNQTGGTSLEAFSNAGWVVFADNGGTV